MAYLFLDLETTGLDPKNDHILEMAWAVTDNEFNLLKGVMTFLVRPFDWSAMWAAYRNAPTVVKEMHRRSGLSTDLLNRDEAHFANVDEIYERLMDDIAWLEPVHLAGFSIHFDKAFMLENGFEDLFDRVIHHRMLDLSSVKMMLDSSDVHFKKADNSNPHRALADVHESIEQARIFRDLLKETNRA